VGGDGPVHRVRAIRALEVRAAVNADAALIAAVSERESVDISRSGYARKRFRTLDDLAEEYCALIVRRLLLRDEQVQRQDALGV